MNILVACAHPDDEVLSMGGTIAKLTAAGNIVHCWFYFQGENCNEETQTQLEEVATILGSQYPPLSFKLGVDNESDTVPMIDIARSIEHAIETVQPEVVYTHSAHDLSVDHRRVAEATLLAARPKLDSCVNRVLSYEVPAATDWAFGQLGGVFKPDVFEDIGETMELKLLALGCYDEFLYEYPHPMSLDAIEIRARARGLQMSVEFAEGFELVWERN